MQLKCLEEKVENPRYRAGFKAWEKIGMYIELALAASFLAGIMYISCANDARAGQFQVENMPEQHYAPAQNELNGEPHF